MNFAPPRRTLRLRPWPSPPAALLTLSLPAPELPAHKAQPFEAQSPPTPLIATLRALRKYWGTALGVALALTLAVAFHTLGQTKIYQATGTIIFDPNPPRPLGTAVETVVDMGAGNYWSNQEYYSTQYKVVQSMRVALGVVRQLGLHHDPAFIANLPKGAPIADSSSVEPEVAAAIVQGRLTVEPVRESRITLLRYEDANPERAQRVLGTLIDVYIEQNLDDALSSTGAAVDWLRGQLDKLRGELESSEMRLHDYKLNNNILSIAFDDRSNMLKDEVKQLSDALTQVRTKRQAILARNRELSKVSADDPSELPATELLESVVLQNLRRLHGEAVRDRDGIIGQGKGRNHPDVLAAEARVSATREALLAEIKNIQAAAERDLAQINHQEAGLAALLDKSKRQALDLNLLEIEYNRLNRTRENNEKLYQIVLERTKESDLAQMMRVNNIRVLDAPLMPRNPIRPRVSLNIFIGMLFGSVLGVGAAAARALLDRTLKTPDDVERELGLPFLGLIPQIEPSTARATTTTRRRRRAELLESRELIVHEFPQSGIAEASRAIRTNLMFMAPDHPYRALLVTSASPSEGKTTVACCVAIAMAQAGQRVLIVDCDLRRPRMHRIFNRDPRVGVTSALLDPELLSDAALATDIPNLSVLPAGPIPPNPSEILHSEKFRSVLEQLRQRYDRVIIDSPPVATVTDAAILSTLVDGTMLVVRAFKTQSDVGRQGARALRDVGAKIAGSVLNSVDLDRHEYKYYHYYYHKEGYYSSSPSDDESMKAPSDAA